MLPYPPCFLSFDSDTLHYRPLTDPPILFNIMTAYTGAINHISLSCSDLTKSKTFYNFLLVDLMGYSIDMDEPFCVIYAKKTGEGNVIVLPGNKF